MTAPAVSAANAADLLEDAGHYSPSDARTSDFGAAFSWSETARVVGDPRNYVLSAADWLTLVEKFGLAADVHDAARKG